MNKRIKVCSRCVLPETYPGIHFDEQGICNICREYEATRETGNNGDREINRHFSNENELKECLRKYKNPGNKYDVLVPLSGGVDSCFTLINIVEKFNLKPLVFHSDHGWDDKTATANVEKLCKTLDVDLIIWKNDLSFMRTLFKYFNESAEIELSACFVCGNMLYLNGLELADRFHIPLVINGYSKGQAAMMHDREKARKWYGKMTDIILQRGDIRFFEAFCKKWKLLEKQVIYRDRRDLEKKVNPGKLLFIPLFVFRFYKTDKEALQEICAKRFAWKPLETSYPARTTNCKMIWLNSYLDLQKRNYTHYHDEYSTLIRAGEITRGQALEDLELHPPQGLLEELAREVNIDLEALRRKWQAPGPSRVKQLVYAQSVQSHEGEFGF